MNINNAEFIISAVGPNQYPLDGLPEVALAGRSNVGKSSLINNLLQRRKLARTSSTPGRTQTLNFYKVDEAMYFVDLPGYGYAKVSKTMREKWGAFIESYLTQRQQLKLLLLIVDLRHPPTKDDQLMYDWMKHNNVPIAIVATKADKLPKGKWVKHLKVVKETLGVHSGDPVIMYSSETGKGRDELWQLLEAAVAGESDAANGTVADQTE